MSEGNILPSNIVIEEDDDIILTTNKVSENAGLIDSNNKFYLER